jgi:hypothetical protein
MALSFSWSFAIGDAQLPPKIREPFNNVGSATNGGVSKLE